MDPEADLVFPPELATTISNASNCCLGPDRSKTSVLEVIGNRPASWNKDLGLDALQAFVTGMGRRATSEEEVGQRRLRIFFVSGERDAGSYHVHVDPRVLDLLRQEAQMSQRFLSDIYVTEEWTRLDYGSAIRRGPERDVKSLEVQYGFWSWDRDTGHSFVRFQTDFTTTTYFCINFHPEIIERIVASVETRPVCAKRLFHIDVLITDALLSNYRGAISSRNTQLIGIEKEHDDSSLAVQTRRLHSLSVNWHTIYKDLVDLEEQIQHFRQIYDAHAGEGEGRDSPVAPMAGCGQTLAQLESKCRFYRRWAMTYRDRTTSRINLLHHLAMQQDNRLNQHIGNVTTQVALQTQRDGASMFTLAVVTTIFLPPTFVAGIMGTPFFSTIATTLKVSSSFWIYWAIALPLTAVVLTVWIFWFRRRLKLDRKAILSTNQDAELGKMDPLRFLGEYESLRAEGSGSSGTGREKMSSGPV